MLICNSCDCESLAVRVVEIPGGTIKHLCYDCEEVELVEIKSAELDGAEFADDAE